jgi:hypothetical protein
VSASSGGRLRYLAISEDPPGFQNIHLPTVIRESPARRAFDAQDADLSKSATAPGVGRYRGPAIEAIAAEATVKRGAFERGNAMVSMPEGCH